MIIETSLILFILLGLLVGCIIGTITGLTPGLHINMVALLTVLASPFLVQYFPLIAIVSFIVAMSITHTFIDFIPSVFLGAPDSDTGLAVLPGHSLLLEGKGHQAVMYSLYGGLIGIVIILLFTPIFIFFLPKVYPYLKPVIFYILLFASFYVIIREKNKTLSLIIFLLAGFLGLAVFNLDMKESLLPMLTGLFGSSSLITSIIKKQKIPKQTPSLLKVRVKLREIFGVAGATALASPLCSFLPALGSGQAAVISSDLTEEKNKRQFLMLLGSINTIVMGLSIISLYSLTVSRSGSAVAISQLLTSFTLSNLIILIGVILVSGLLSFFIGSKLSRILASRIHKINYANISLFILLFLTTVIISFSGILGLFVFIVSTFLGLFTILSNSRRTLLMGCLMLTSLVLYFPI
jgi:putative membrane protein